MNHLPRFRLVLGTLSLLAATTLAAEAQTREAREVSEAIAATNYVPAHYPGKPYGGVMRPLPGIIQAEHYDVAPGATNGITFSHHAAPAQTDIRLGPDSVGLVRCGEGHVSIVGKPEEPAQAYVSWTRAGEWLKYTVRVKESGSYALGGHFAAPAKGAKITVAFTPGVGTAPIEIPTTAGYQPGVEPGRVWQTLDDLAEIQLVEGVHVMTVRNESDAVLNVDYLTLTRKR